MKWYTGGEEHPGRQDKVKHNLPPNIDIRPIPGYKTLSGMLERGEIDAMISAHMPSPFVRRNTKVQRLIANFREVEQDYFKRTKIFPIMHRSEEHTSELQSPCNLVCRLLLEKKN